MQTRLATDGERRLTALFGDVVAERARLPGRRQRADHLLAARRRGDRRPTMRSSACSRSSAAATTPTGARSSTRPATAPPTRSTRSADHGDVRRPTRSARRCSPRVAAPARRARPPAAASPSRPYGWPKDAINGALLTLLAAGNIRAEQDGKDRTAPKELPPTQIGKATFYKEDEPPTVRANGRAGRF